MRDNCWRHGFRFCKAAAESKKPGEVETERERWAGIEWGMKILVSEMREGIFRTKSAQDGTSFMQCDLLYTHISTPKIQMLKDNSRALAPNPENIVGFLSFLRKKAADSQIFPFFVFIPRIVLPTLPKMHHTVMLEILMFCATCS